MIKMFKRINVLSQHKYNLYNSIYRVQMIRLKTSSVKLESKPVLKERPQLAISSRWTQDEIKILKEAISKHGMDWMYISKEYFQANRTPSALLNKWKILNYWTEDEIKMLKDAV